MLRYQFVHRKISTLTFTTDHVVVPLGTLSVMITPLQSYAKIICFTFDWALLNCFGLRGNFASPLTGLRFQLRLEIPDPGFVNSNHILQKFVPFFAKSVQQLLCNFNTSTLFFVTEAMRNPLGGNSTFVQAFSQNAICRCSRNSSTLCNYFTCHSAVFLQDLEHTFHTLVISRRSASS